MLKRQRNHRETWNLKLHESVAGNYYPVTTKIALEDSTARMAILTDRAQGGSSLQDGSLELMIHRRLLHDDAFGVGEALNETEYDKGLIARGKHHLFFGQSSLRPDVSLKTIERLVQLETLLPSWKFFSNMNDYSDKQWLTSFTNSVSKLYTLKFIVNRFISRVIFLYKVHWHIIDPTQICPPVNLGTMA